MAELSEIGVSTWRHSNGNIFDWINTASPVTNSIWAQRISVVGGVSKLVNRYRFASRAIDASSTCGIAFYDASQTTGNLIASFDALALPTVASHIPVTVELPSTVDLSSYTEVWVCFMQQSGTNLQHGIVAQKAPARDDVCFFRNNGSIIWPTNLSSASASGADNIFLFDIWSE